MDNGNLPTMFVFLLATFKKNGLIFTQKKNCKVSAI